MSTSGHHPETEDGTVRGDRPQSASERHSGIETPRNSDCVVGPKKLGGRGRARAERAVRGVELPAPHGEVTSCQSLRSAEARPGVGRQTFGAFARTSSR